MKCSCVLIPCSRGENNPDDSYLTLQLGQRIISLHSQLVRERGAKKERKKSERGSGERSGREGKESKDEKKRGRGIPQWDQGWFMIANRRSNLESESSAR